MDYGNTEVIDDCKAVVLPDQYAALDPFARRYWLMAYKPSGRQADEVTS